MLTSIFQTHLLLHTLPLFLILLNLLLQVASASHPNFQHFSVPEAIASTKISITQQPSEPQLKNSLNLKLHHRDHLFPTHCTHSDRFRSRMDRDAQRVASLNRRLDGTLDPESDQKSSPDFGSDVVSGMNQGSGEYFVRIGVGTPIRTQFMAIDTGSDLTWLQCLPCQKCYSQSDPIFNPASSSSFAGVSCDSFLCRRLSGSFCNSNLCSYKLSFRDGSHSVGTLALETLTFAHAAVDGVAVGCGNDNEGMFVGAAGLLGLGVGSMSLVGQLGGQTGGAFSYCLVSRGTNSSGSLIFGREGMPSGAAWIPLVPNLRSPIFYYVGVVGLGVAGVRVQIPEDIFRLTESGTGGVVLDSGTAVTRFPMEAYVLFREAFTSVMGSLPRTENGVSIFDTCYQLWGFETVRVPTVSFYLGEGKVLTLPARNFMIPVDETGTFCFGFAGMESGLSIIGNVQQEGIQISFDQANGLVGFGPGIC